MWEELAEKEWLKYIKCKTFKEKNKIFNYNIIQNSETMPMKSPT